MSDEATTDFPKPGLRVIAHLEDGDSTRLQRGFFVMMDDSGLLLHGRQGQPDYIFVPRERLVMLTSDPVGAAFE